MQRRAAAMYVLFFLLIAVGALAFINVVDAPSDSMDDVEYQLAPEGSMVIDGVEYQLTSIAAFTATLEYLDEASEQATTLTDETTVNVSGVEYQLELPDEEEPTNATLVETFTEEELEDYADRDLETGEFDGVTYVLLPDGETIPEIEYLEQEYGPRDVIELEVGSTFSFIPEETDVASEATVDAISAAGVEISWVGPEQRQVTLNRGGINTIAGTDYGVNFVGDELVQLTSDLDAFEAHQEAHDVWDERHQGFWGIGVLSILGALLIGALSYLPRRR